MAKTGEFFRASVGATVCYQGKVLALRRARRSENPRKEAWQMPQGGIEQGETLTGAMLRELEEETGLGVAQVRILAQHPCWLSYELPGGARAKKKWRGQTQKWFAVELLGDESAITPDGEEFDAWRWCTARELLAEVVAFRRDVYRCVFNEFESYLE